MVIMFLQFPGTGKRAKANFGIRQYFRLLSFRSCLFGWFFCKHPRLTALIYSTKISELEILAASGPLKSTWSHL